MDGDVCVGKLSIGGTIQHMLRPAQTTASAPGLGTTNGPSSSPSVAGTKTELEPVQGVVYVAPNWSVRARVAALSCTGLRSVHALASNSPFVTVVCGPYKDQTKVNLVI
jgi:hypothetical protein